MNASSPKASALPKTNRNSNEQPLCPRTWQDTCRECGVDRNQAELLFRLGLLSFDPSIADEITDTQTDELTFTSRLVFNSGFSQEVAMAMLSQLERPYQYSFDQIYWDFGTGRWKSFAWVVDNFRKHNEVWVVDEIDNELRQADWPTIQSLEEKLKAERLRRDQYDARECFDCLEGYGFEVIIDMLTWIGKSRKLTAVQRKTIRNGIVLLNMFPERWPSESFYIHAKSSGNSSFELSMDDEHLFVEVYYEESFACLFNFNRESCVGYIDPDIVYFCDIMSRNTFDSTFDTFEV